MYRHVHALNMHIGLHLTNTLSQPLLVECLHSAKLAASQRHLFCRKGRSSQ